MNGSSSPLFFELSCTISVPPPPRTPSTPSSPSPQPSCELPKFGLKAHRPFHPSTVSSIRSSTYLRYAPTNHHHLDKIKNQESRIIQNSKIAFIVYVFYLFSPFPLFCFSFFLHFSLFFSPFSFHLLLSFFKHASTQKIYPSQLPTPPFLLATHCFDFFVVSITTRLSIVISCAHASSIHSFNTPLCNLRLWFCFLVVSRFHSLSDNSQINHPSHPFNPALLPPVLTYALFFFFMQCHLSIYLSAVPPPIFHAHTFLFLNFDVDVTFLFLSFFLFCFGVVECISRSFFFCFI
jgi:hypothetical protein